MDATVTGTSTATSMSTNMTMNIQGGTMTQSTTAKRIGDCK
jgi:hypothetical protein